MLCYLKYTHFYSGRSDVGSKTKFGRIFYKIVDYFQSFLFVPCLLYILHAPCVHKTRTQFLGIFGPLPLRNAKNGKNRTNS
jgi:hypothetical protein